MFYFVRHGVADDTETGSKFYRGIDMFLCKLSDEGAAQIENAAKDERLQGADIIICSPYTRAVHSAAILSKALGAPIAIETDLHEWIADKSYAQKSDEETVAAMREFLANRGEYPAGEERAWESAADIRARVLAVLRRYSSYDRVIVIGHGLVILSLTGEFIPNGGVLEYELPEE
ncbi:MAG: histidine phosphatase family protein [Clostridia bacterium]|nr:histidine phosphatase family protein [Clostridia bacterium]